jgi:hypothetical protein
VTREYCVPRRSQRQYLDRCELYHVASGLPRRSEVCVGGMPRFGDDEFRASRRPKRRGAALIDALGSELESKARELAEANELLKLRDESHE